MPMLLRNLTMLMLLLLALHIVFIDCRCPPSKRAPRAIDGTDEAGFVADQNAPSGNAIAITSSNDPNTALDPDNSSPSIDYSEQPDDGSIRLAANLQPGEPDYANLCKKGSEKLACCKTLTMRDLQDPVLRNVPELHIGVVCIWFDAFDPDGNAVHDWIYDWCMNQNLACCTASDKAAPLWEECRPLRIPSPVFQYAPSPYDNSCPVRVAPPRL